LTDEDQVKEKQLRQGEPQNIYKMLIDVVSLKMPVASLKLEGKISKMEYIIQMVSGIWGRGLSTLKIQ